MQPTSTGTYRVLARSRRRSEVIAADTDDYEPLSVSTAGLDEGVADAVDGLLPGYVIDATLAWADDGTARFAAVEVVERTLLEFVDGATNLFEPALDTMQEARRDGLGVNSQVTYGENRELNGVVYAFAKQPGREVFEEFRSGSLPLEPLVERAAEERDPPFELFVLRPPDHEFVIVYLVFEKESVLADTVRETYYCPRPEEPLAGAT